MYICMHVYMCIQFLLELIKVVNQLVVVRRRLSKSDHPLVNLYIFELRTW